MIIPWQFQNPGTRNPDPSLIILYLSKSFEFFTISTNIHTKATGIWVGSFFIVSGTLVIYGYKNKNSMNEESKFIYVILIMNIISALGAITMIILAIYSYQDRFGLVMHRLIEFDFSGLGSPIEIILSHF